MLMFLSKCIRKLSEHLTKINKIKDNILLSPTEKFPRGGLMSQHVFSLEVGDEMRVWGPRGKIRYFGNGNFKEREDKENGLFDKKHSCKHIGMLCGGTGLAPMLQVIRAILDNPADNTNISLIFANRTEEDILCRSELDDLAKDSRLSVNYCLSKPSSTWNGDSGYITSDMVKRHLPPPSKDVFILLCGSAAMVNDCYLPNLTDYDQDRIFVY